MQVRQYALATGDNNKKGSESKIDAGHDFIRDNGPTNSEGNAINRWVAKQLINPESPIYGWHPTGIKGGIRNNNGDHYEMGAGDGQGDAFSASTQELLFTRWHSGGMTHVCGHSPYS